MKKTIFGYDKQSTDDYIRTLENQADIMSTKLTDLTMELNSVNQELSSLKEISKSSKDNTESQEKLTKRIQELEKNNAALSQQCNQLREEKNAQVSELTYENDMLSNQLAAYKESLSKLSANQRYDARNSQYTLSAARDCAYRDMDYIRQNISEEIMEHIDAYIAAVEDANNRMKAIIGETRADYASIVDNLSKSINNAFEGLVAIDEYNQRIEADMIPTQRMALDLKSKVAELTEAARESETRILNSFSDSSNTSDSGDLYNKVHARFNIKPEFQNYNESFSSINQMRNNPTGNRSFPNYSPNVKRETSRGTEKPKNEMKINTKINPIDVFDKKY